MLKSLWAKGFLSLRDVRLELGKLNVLVGPNASGKSNVIRALALLSAHAREGPVLEDFEEARSLIFGFNGVSRAEVGGGGGLRRERARQLRLEARRRQLRGGGFAGG